MKFVSAILVALVSMSAGAQDFSPCRNQPAQCHDKNLMGWFSKTISGSQPRESVSLGGTYFVEYIEVVGEARGSNTRIGVYVNNVRKGDLDLPLRDPHFWITIREEIHSINFVHEGGGTGVITEIIAHVYDVPQGQPQDGQLPPNGMGYPHGDRMGKLNGSNFASQMAVDALNTVDALELAIKTTEEVQYLDPIREAAGDLYAVADAYGDMSDTTRARLVILANAINNADVFLTQHMSSNAARNSVIKLKQVRFKILHNLN